MNNLFKGRIKNMLNFKKPAVWVIAVSAVLVAALSIGFAADRANDKTIGDVDVHVEVTGDIPDAVIDYAKDYVGQQAVYYNEVGKDLSAGMRTYTIIDAKITGLTEINTGTAWENKAVSMWLLEYRLLPDNPGNVMLAGGMQMEEIDGQSWLTEWGSTGQPYLLLESKYFNAELIWRPICVTNTDIIMVDYGTPEILERYGNAYTAAAMELYNKYVSSLDAGKNGTGFIPENWELIINADVNGDGLEESIYLDKTQMDTDLSVTLRIFNSVGNEIWNKQLFTSHVGWDQLFLAELGGRQYLLRYNPSMFQGYCTYTYTLFTTEHDGKEKVFQTNTLEFDINGTKELDAGKMIGFADEVNAFLKKSRLLISSDGGAWNFGLSSAEPFYERYSWLDGTTRLYNDGDSLETKLNKFSDYAIYNRKLRDLLIAGYTGSHSDKFSEEEIRDAMESVIAKFRGFKGCELTKLWYDEEKSDNQIKSYMTGGRGSDNGVSKDNVIVIYSDFSVDSSGGEGSLNPNSTYTDWCWILIRDSGGGDWRVDDWGY